MAFASYCAPQGLQVSLAPLVSRPRRNLGRATRYDRLSSVSEKAEERLQSSLAALDALLLPTAESNPTGEFPEEG